MIHIILSAVGLILRKAECGEGREQKAADSHLMNLTLATPVIA